jgi:hypothetical protein
MKKKIALFFIQQKPNKTQEIFVKYLKAKKKGTEIGNSPGGNRSRADRKSAKR